MRVKLTFTSKVESDYSTVLCGSYKSTTYREKSESGFVIIMFKCLKPTVQFQTRLFKDRDMDAIEQSILSYVKLKGWVGSVFFTIEDGHVIEEDMR